MLKPVPEHITYGQYVLIILIKNRELRKWCIENNLDHAHIYRLAIGEKKLNYKLIFTLRHLIDPSDFFYLTTENRPRIKKISVKADLKEYNKTAAFIFLQDIISKGWLVKWA